MPRPPAVSPSPPSPSDRKNITPRDLTLPPSPGRVPVHCFAGRQGPDRSKRPGFGGSVAHGRGGARGLRPRAGRCPLPLLEPPDSPKEHVGKGVIAPHEKPPDGELDEAAKGTNRNVNQDPPGGRADHRQHQVLNNPFALPMGNSCTYSIRTSPPSSCSTRLKSRPEAYSQHPSKAL